MPTSLTPRYHTAEAMYRWTGTIADKIDAPGTIMAMIPEHRGTEHLRGEPRARLMPEYGRAALGPTPDGR